VGVSEAIYSYGLCLLSIVLIILISYLQFKIAKSSLRQWCMLIVTCALISNISIIFQIVNITNTDVRILYEAFSYIGITILPICLCFAIIYFLNPNFKFKKKYLLLFLIPIITIIAIFTNEYHHLVFKEFSTNYWQCQYGIIFYINLINMYATYTLGIILLIKYFSQNIKKYFWQLTISMLLIVLPIILQALGIMKIIHCKTYINGIVQSFIAIISIGVLLRYQILTQIPISLSNVFNTISDGFIIINKKGIIITYNKIFLNLFDLGKLNIKKMDIRELIEYKEFDTLYDEDIDNILKLNNEEEEMVFERTSDTLGLTLKYEANILDRTKNKLFLISIADITQYSKHIQNIKLNHEAMISKERLASLGQMIGRNST
jgi:PAS domain-containing protein